MRSFITRLTVGACLLVMSSCEQEAAETWVWGTFVPDSNGASETPIDGSEERPLSGTLAAKSADYIGSCVYAEKRFSFTVASKNRNNLGPADFYFEINNINGPPSKNPYTAQGAPREDEERAFRSGYIWTAVGGWTIQPDDIIENRCRVVLFSEAGSGDLTPVKFGKKSFQYLVKIECPAGLDSIESSMPDRWELNGLNAELWFDNCE